MKPLIPNSYRMAQGLHLHRFAVLPLALVLMLALACGCVVLRELEVETTDAGFSAPPVIVSATPPFPGPFTLNRDDPDAEVSLLLRDNDLEDTLHVRLFLDYDEETGEFQAAECIAPAAEVRDRTVNCPVIRVCTALDPGDTSLHQLEVVVTDREWLTDDDDNADGQPPRRAVAKEASRVTRGWTVSCQ